MKKTAEVTTIHYIKGLTHGFIIPVMISLLSWFAMNLDYQNFPIHLVFGSSWLYISYKVYETLPNLPSREVFNKVALLTAVLFIFAFSGWLEGGA